MADAETQSEGGQMVTRSGVAQTDAGPALVDAGTQADRTEDGAAKSAGDHEAALRCFLKGREAEVKAKEAEKLAEQKQQVNNCPLFSADVRLSPAILTPNSWSRTLCRPLPSWRRSARGSVSHNRLQA